jgi:hypothetical protein
MVRPRGVVPPVGVDFIQLSKIRGAANGKEVTSRGRKKSAQEYMGAAAGGSPQAAYSGEARAPKSIIQEGKKGIRGLIIVFMEIRAVTGFVGQILTREKPASFPV